MVSERLKALEVLRDRLAAEVEREIESGYCESCKRGSSSLASLAGQYRETLREIEDLTKGVKKGSLVDELAKRRGAGSSTTPRRTTPDRRRQKPGA